MTLYPPVARGPAAVFLRCLMACLSSFSPLRESLPVAVSPPLRVGRHADVFLRCVGACLPPILPMMAAMPLYPSDA